MKPAFFALFALIALSNCSSPQTASPEDQVQAVLNEIKQAVEARSRSKVLEHVSDKYRDHQGKSKDDIGKILQLHFIRNQNINLFTSVHSIEVDGDVASVELSAAMAAQNIDLTVSSNRLRADTARFSAVLMQTDGEWLLTSLGWQKGW